jgi:hypothetical protein
MSPPSSTAYQVDPQFSGTDGPCTNPVFLLPPQSNEGEAISVDVPWIYTGESTFPAGPSNDDFAISFDTVKSGSAEVNVVNVQILANNAWRCAPAARASLMANFVDILTAVEPLELNGQLSPGATMRIAEVIADNLPAPVSETLFYRYGLSSGFPPTKIACVDIRPGMRLRIETSITQFVTTNPAMNQYIAAGRFLYDVGSMPSRSPSSPLRVVTFDPFLGAIATPQIKETSTGAGGIVDLMVAGGTQSYWRLFYPPQMQPPGSPGDTSLGDNVALIGAPNYTALQTATQKYPTPPPSPDSSSVFLGRSIAIPEIPIWIKLPNQANLLYVSVGTTVANIIERIMTIPLDPNQTIVTMTRVSNLPVGNPGRATNNLSVDFFPGGGAALDPRVFDLPLIAGDAITFTF